jgi:hypothetical protein
MLRSILLVAAVCAARPALAGMNLLGNSSFEAGDAGWTLWNEHPADSDGGVVELAEARHGTHCFRVENRGTGGANLYSDLIPADGEADYTLSVYMRAKGARDARVALWAEDAAGRVIAYELPYAVAGPSDEPGWARLKSIVHTPKECTGLRAHLICSGGTVWWDAVQVESGRDTTLYRRGPEPGDGDVNLLANSGFELGELDWSLWHQDPSVSRGGVDKGAGRDGSAALVVVNPGPGGANLHSDPVPCQPGTTYTLSVYARVAHGESVAIGGWAQTASGDTLSYAVDGVEALPAEVPTLTRFAKTFTTPEGCRLLKAHLICNGGEVTWDDCQLERADTPHDYQPGPAREPLRPYAGPERIEYTGAIIAEARLRDVLAQGRRLSLYAGAAGRDDASEQLDEAEAAVARVSATLGAPYLVPDYREVDYTALATHMRDAENALGAAFRILGEDAAGLFRPWRPVLPEHLTREVLADSFVIFPCFTRDIYLHDESGWELLAPYGFRIVSAWLGLQPMPDGSMGGAGMEFARLCGQHGYAYDIEVEGVEAVRDELAARLGEDAYLHNAKDEWSPQGNCHNTINIFHPEVRAAATAFLRHVAAELRGDARFSSYELTNEPSLTIERHVHGYDYEAIGVGGYSRQAVAAWHAWLQQRYGTIGALNAAWRARYEGFAAVDPPADLLPPVPTDGGTPVPVAAIHDFQVFRAEAHASWFADCVAALHEGDPDRAVSSQFYSPPVQRADAAVDLRRMAEGVPWDLYGVHDWPGAGPATTCLYAVSMDRRAGHPIWEDEFIFSQWERKGTPEPVMRAAIERNLWRQIAWGKRGISLFNLESEWAHDGPGNWNNSLLNIEADLEVPRYSTGVIPTVERKANRFKDVLYRTRIAPTDVAILRPTASTLVAAPDRRTNDECNTIAAHLLEAHETPVLVPEEHIADWPEWHRGVKLLVLPWSIHLPEAVQEKLLAWVRAGGTVLATGPAGLFDELGNPSGTLLRASIGDREWRYTEADGRWALGPARGDAPADVRESEPAADLPKLLRATVGEGAVYLWPGAVSAGGDAGRLEVIDAVVGEVVPVPFVATELPSVEIVTREDDAGGRYLFLVNLDATAAATGEVLVRGDVGPVVDMSCDARPAVPTRSAEGVTSIPVRLHAGGGVFLSLGAG